ncbi:hypothetical protein B0T16DRAFT_461987 [Cercophora newfieldiana]|uniref:Uncharacterized protein n=1 Tax=Cercophora newfieldiana TaxID=92897 RepID=A0AA39XXL8_9PEZI|nr:hypothetical protein B0T16DRAFT_461987 [Cercophora newfieldiana]
MNNPEWGSYPPLLSCPASQQQHFPVQQVQPAPVQFARPSVAELLRQKDRTYTPLITSREDLERLKKEHEAINDVAPTGSGKDDVDYPKTPEKEQEYVKQLFHAIIDFSNVVENATHIHLNRVRGMSDFEIQCIAWDLLIAIEDAHCGKLGFPARNWDNEWRYQEFDSFKARFDAVVAAVRRSKSIAYGGCPVSFVKRVASAPAKELAGKETNNSGNSTKRDQLKAGKQVLAANQPPATNSNKGSAGKSARGRTKAGRVTKTPAGRQTSGSRQPTAPAEPIYQSFVPTASNSAVAQEIGRVAGAADPTVPNRMMPYAVGWSVGATDPTLPYFPTPGDMSGAMMSTTPGTISPIMLGEANWFAAPAGAEAMVEDQEYSDIDAYVESAWKDM